MLTAQFKCEIFTNSRFALDRPQKSGYHFWPKWVPLNWINGRSWKLKTDAKIKHSVWSRSSYYVLLHKTTSLFRLFISYIWLTHIKSYEQNWKIAFNFMFYINPIWHGLFWNRQSLGGGRDHDAPHHDFVVIALMITKFSSGIKLDVFYTMVTKSLWRQYYYVIMTS